MSTDRFTAAMGYIDDDLISDAVTYMPKKKEHKFRWMKLAAAAACVCLVVMGAFSIPSFQNEPTNNQDTKDTIEQLYTLSQVETMYVELVEWGKKDHFKGIVVDAGDNSIFPVGAKLSVVFDYDTEILLDDGTLMLFNPDEPDVDVIGWKEGTIVTVRFVNYAEYREGNNFYNHVYPSYVEPSN